MGAWDVGSFDNDAALDFIDGFTRIDDLTRAFAALGPEEACADADAACDAIAAADVVAAMMGRPAPDMPDRLGETVAGLGAASEALIAAAVRAVRHARTHSELAELWAAAEEEDWQSAVDDLLARLDPEIPYTPPPPRDDAPVGEIMGVCLLCDGSIPEADIVTVTLEDDDGIAGVSLTLYAHRECLEKTYDPPHFTDDGAPHPDLLTRIKAHLDSMI